MRRRASVSCETPLGEFPPIWRYHVLGWDYANSCGHNLELGPWNVATFDRSRSAEWQPLCWKACVKCGGLVSIDRRYSANSLVLRLSYMTNDCEVL